MANIQLFLENQEVELTDKVSFPLNKSFENLWNPTDIIVEYSKSINIPASRVNNQIMANAYRLDRQFNGADSATNIGMYLNPLKRIPMKLIHNGSILLDGYAKYASSTVSNKKTYYTFNLYGALGDVFQTLMDCVVDEKKLTDEQKAEADGGQKYVIKSLWEEQLIDRNFVKDSWENEDIIFDYLWNPHNCVGMAPAYRGLYDNFESTSALGLNWYTILDGTFPTEPQSIEDQLKSRWRGNLINNGYTAEKADSRIDALDYQTIVPKGLSEHQLQQFRSYEQKPFIYAHALMRLFQSKCYELTGYTMNLDPSWFSPNNPYYSNMCYMFDYLSVKGNTLQTGLPFTGYAERRYSTSMSNSNNVEYSAPISYTISDTDIIDRGKITLKPFTIGIRQETQKLNKHTDYTKCRIELEKFTEILVRIQITSGSTTETKYYWGATGVLGEVAALSSPDSNTYKPENFIQMTEDTKYDVDTGKLIGTGYITIPSISFEHYSGDPISIKYIVSMHCVKQSGGSTISGRYAYGNEFINYMRPSTNNTNFYVVMPNVEYDANWRNSTTCSIKNLYSKDEPLFNVVLQYTKMMGLVWKVDYQNKSIDIMPRSKYFKDYQIVDWTNKVDKAKGMTIEPVSFNSKYVTFNYEDIEGNKYSGYRNKYGVDYGEKKIRTKYNFDINETKFFKDKIYPSSVSCKAYPSISDLKSWTTLDMLPTRSSEVNFIDAEDEEQEKAISINNWYFRGPNKSTLGYYYISDVSQVELKQNKYFWLGNGMVDYYGIGEMISILPQFTPVYKSNVNGLTFGCLFNCPNEDYTYDSQLINANGNYIYDICWSDYVNERYNANNKKVTCYIRLTPLEFQTFNFKTFVVIDNQLFVVNKIFDYDVKAKTTKVELIQVTNINGYTEQKHDFPEIIFSDAELRIKTTGGIGSAVITMRSYPAIEYGDYDITYVKRGSTNSQCFVEDAEFIGNEVLLAITYESDGNYTEEWELEITKFGKSYVIPIYVN